LKQATIAIVGSGHVGLPTAVSFANAGCLVCAVDADERIVRGINSGLDPVGEPGLEEEIKRNISLDRLRATTDTLLAAQQSDAIVISVPTPVAERQPDLRYLENVLEKVAPALNGGKTIIIVSTIPPGTMRMMVRPFLEQRSGLVAERDFYLAYVPERIAPGNALKDLLETPRLVGGVGPKSTEVAAELFGKICRRIITATSDTAEASKLVENSFRDVNIAFANELALVCERLGIDVCEVIELANTHPRVSIHKPGGGVGGPCLPKDPWLLLHGGSDRDFQARIIPIARAINDSMPAHVVRLVERALNSVGKEVRGATVSVLGTAYKGGTSDTRLTPSASVIGDLAKLGCKVIAYDPYASEVFAARRANSLEEATSASDCLVVMTDHSEFKHIDLEKCKQTMTDRPAIVDGRRLIDPGNARRLGFAYFAVGYGVVYRS